MSFVSSCTVATGGELGAREELAREELATPGDAKGTLLHPECTHLIKALREPNEIQCVQNSVIGTKRGGAWHSGGRSREVQGQHGLHSIPLELT